MLNLRPLRKKAALIKAAFFLAQGVLLSLIALSSAVSAFASGTPRQNCFSEYLCFTTIEDRQSAQLLVRNDFDIPIRVSVRMTGKSITPSELLINIPLLPGESREAFYVKAQPGKSWRYTWKSEYHPGLDQVFHDEDILYDLPFAADETYPISQGPNGSFSHFGVNRHAIDWAMPIGTEVLAAREGRVIGYREDANTGGASAEYKSEQNYIWIQHNDDTIGQYLHLQQFGVTVKIGDRVERGQLIGFSGNTGYSTVPHLHFHVSGSQEQGDAFRTFPLRFKER